MDKRASGPDTIGPDKIEATFRNGSLTAISVLVGFSLSFLTRWSGLPGAWDRADLAALVVIGLGIAFQIVAVALLLSVASLRLSTYRRAVRVFLTGLALAAIGVAIVIVGDIAAASRA